MLYTSYRIGIFLATHCSRNMAYRCADIYARVWYLFDGRRKRIVRAHLKAIFESQHKALDSSEFNQLTLRTFQQFSKYLFEVFRMPLMDKEYIEKYIDPLDASELDTVLKEGKGAIIFTAHFGNWEMAGVVMALLGYPMAVVALAHSDPHINQLFLSLREKFGMSIIDLDKYAARECIKTLRHGKALALLGDEDFSDTHIEIEYLGEKIQVPRGPAALSHATGAPVFPCLMIRQPDNRFIIQHEKAIYPIKTDKQEKDIKLMTQKYLEALAPFFIKYPDQWYRFR